MRIIPFLIMTVWVQVAYSEIVPDRPGFSTGTYTVKKGVTQVEVGVQANPKDSSLIFPQLNIRSGVNENTELNIYWDGATFYKGEFDTYSEVKFGFKHRIVESDSHNFSFLWHALFNENRVLPHVQFLWDYNLYNINLFGTVQFEEIYGEGRYISYINYSVGVSKNISGKLSGYVEAYSLRPLNNSKTQEEYFGLGLAWLITNSAQLDLSIDIPYQHSDFWSISTGLSLSF